MKLPFVERLLKGRISLDKGSIGIDIGTSSIKIVKVKFSKDSAVLSDLVVSPSTLDISEILKKSVDPKECEGVNIAVSGPATLIRYISFPKMNSEELRQAMKFEAQKHIPFSLNDINIDSFILKEDLPDNKMLVLLAAVKKDFMKQRQKLIDEVGLKVKIIDIDSVALVNAFNYNYAQDEKVKTKTIALLNIGASVANLNILESGIPHLSRDIHIGGNNFTQKLVDVLGLDFKGAEALKLNPDKDKANNVVTSVESVLSHLASEIRISFDYYESQAASSVTKIFLSGGGSLLTGLKEMLTNLLGIEVEHWTPTKKITLANTVDANKVKSQSSQLAVAVGLALHS